MPDGLNATLPDTLKVIRSKALFVMRLEVAPILDVGATPGADRRVGIVTGDRFEGDRVSGRVIGGNDWQTVRNDGSVSLDVRLVLEATDHALITMTYRGLRHGPPDVIARLNRGEAVDADAYYFRISPSFETSSERHHWLNGLLAIGIGHRMPDGPIYSVFEVL